MALSNTIRNHLDHMFRNNIKIILRHLLRNKVYTLINISGLTVGITCCLLIFVYVHHELSYDNYHTKSERTFRVLHAYLYGDKRGNTDNLAPSDFQVWGSAPAGPVLQAEFPEIESYVRFTSSIKILVASEEKKFQESNVYFIDSTAFEIFDWKIISGNPESALKEPNSIVLTESTAIKYFGTVDAVGNLLKIDNSDEVMVTAVIEDVPPNSQFRFDMLLSMSTFHEARPNIFDSWGYVDFYTYFVLKPNSDIENIRSQIPDFLSRHIKDGMGYMIDFEPMENAYLSSQAARQPGPTGNMNNIYIFSSIAVFILIIACINFMNLSTARSMERAREVGIRKSIGAVRSELIKQFLIESIMLAIFSAFIALVLTEFALPLIKNLTGKEFVLENLRTPQLIGIIFFFTILLGIFAGSYPALVLSSFKPATILKGSFKSSAKGSTFRKGLVIFQFCLSIILIAGTFVVFTQLNHLRSKSLGFDREQMLIIDFAYDDMVRQNLTTIRSSLLEHPDVVSISASRAVPGYDLPGAYTRIEGKEGELVHRSPHIYEVDPYFFPHFNIEFIAGRPFSDEIFSDSTKALIVNEAAAREYGYSDPEDIIGKKFMQWGREGMVIGVTENFNYQSLHRNVEPLTIRYADAWNSTLFTLKINSNNYHQTLAELEKTWNMLVPHHPFTYKFLDNFLDQQYNAEERFGHLFIIFAGLAIFIACLGLYGLSTYITEQRIKEIGIRKILGASVSNILTLLTKDFVRLILIGIVIAIPISYFLMDSWLNDFIYRTDLGVNIFIISAVIPLLIALLTVIWQSLKSAFTNPVDSLRSE